MKGYFYEKNVMNLITFSLCTLSAVPYCCFVGRQEKMFKFLFISQSLELFCTVPWTTVLNLFSWLAWEKWCFTFLISRIVYASVTEVKPCGCYIISSIKNGQLWFSIFWGLPGILRFGAFFPIAKHCIICVSPPVPWFFFLNWALVLGLSLACFNTWVCFITLF